MQRPDPDLLAKIPIFRRVLPEDRARISAVSHLRDYHRGDPVFDEGDPSDFFYVVGTGRVKPSVYFRPMAQPTSSRPAIRSSNQAMAVPFGSERFQG